MTGDMIRQAQNRMDSTRSDETEESMLYVRGNPDAFGPDAPMVQTKPQRSPAKFKQPKIRTSVDRQE
jgi:hypothetical protein